MYDELCAIAREGAVKYAKLQLGTNLLACKTGLHLYHRSKSSQTWTCSETPIRVLPVRVLDYFDIRSYSADFYAPAGDKLPSIERLTEEKWLKSEPAIEREHPDDIMVRFSYSTNLAMWASRQICNFTGGHWSHVAIVFYVGQESVVYFESVWLESGEEGS